MEMEMGMGMGMGMEAVVGPTSRWMGAIVDLALGAFCLCLGGLICCHRQG